MAIDKNETKNELFGGFKKAACSESSEVTKLGSPTVQKSESPELPKWKTMDKVTAMITSEQRLALESLVHKIMKSRYPSTDFVKERITANTVLRALLDNLIERLPSLEMMSIRNEADLKMWLSQLFH